MTNSFQKVFFLLSPLQKKKLYSLAVLLLIGMLFEMTGLGILIPSLSLILNPDLGNKYPIIKPLLNRLGNPTHLNLVIWSLGVMVFFYIIKSLYLLFLSWKQSKFSADLSAELSQNLFMGYLKQPYQFHLNKNSAQLLRNIQIEINQFTAVSTAFVNLTLEICVLIGVAFLLIWVEPIGAIALILFLGLSAFLFHHITKHRLLKWGEIRQKCQGIANQHLLQGLGGAKEVKVLGKEEYFYTEFTIQNQKYAKVMSKMTTLSLSPRFYLELLAVIGMAGLIFILTYQNNSPEFIIPILGIFVSAAFRMIPSVNRIMNSVQTIRFSKPVVGLLYNEFNLLKKIDTFDENILTFNLKNSLIISNLTFNYDDTIAKAIDDVSIEIKKGNSIGLIGTSGSGKSTLVDIILGLLIPQQGIIEVDGINIHKNLRIWQNQIGYVPQSIYLTDDSIKKNIAFGVSENEIDNQAVNNAIISAQLDEFINSLPLGIETLVGERGVRLSGGQRQRIGIARALYNNPTILLLDEATSALDLETETEVMKAVNALHGEKTILIVAHRLSTVSNCDWIYKLNKGVIVEQGTPKNLSI
jgi:ABC-type multidrug transport system fused ATPase/permease subunit